MKLYRLGIIPVLLIALTIALGCSDDEGNGPVPLNTNVVWVDDVTATTSDPQVRVNVRFANVDPLSGVAIPLYVSGTGFTVDSVSFKGGRVSDAAVLESHVDTLAQTVAMVALAGAELIPRGEGIFASLYFTLAGESQGQTLTIDSTTIGTESLVYVDSTGQGEVDPEFESGEISVLY
jgi:hypothetical protein